MRICYGGRFCTGFCVSYRFYTLFFYNAEEESIAFIGLHTGTFIIRKGFAGGIYVRLA